MVAVAAEVWKTAPQKAAQAIDRLMALRLVSGTAIVNWVFDSRGVRQLDDELATGLAWEVLYNAVDKMLARAQVWLSEFQGLQASISGKASVHCLCIIVLAAW